MNLISLKYISKNKMDILTEKTISDYPLPVSIDNRKFIETIKKKYFQNKSK